MLFAVFLLLLASDPIADAVGAIQRNNTAEAERILRTELQAHPNNADALGVLGVVLDQEKKYSEADAVYRRAISLTPDSAPLLNNYGNHLLAFGKLSEARDVFLKVVKLDPLQANANLQLGMLAIRRKAPAEALERLDRLPAAVQHSGDAEIVRMQALYGLNRTAEADAVLARLAGSARNDARLSYSLGVALSGAGQYEQAEDLFSRSLAADPDNFDVLYRLGLAASHAGHNERAREVLETALRQRPRDVDVLFDLAAVNASLGQRERALQLLAEGARLEPGRAEVQQLIARTTADLGYFGDSVQAWDRYLKIVPGDEVAQRERAFALTAIGDETGAGLARLKAYAAKHPNDPVGHYELGVAQAVTAPEQAVSEMNRALALKPDLTAAHIARGLIRFKQGDYAGALPDFEFAVAREPGDPVVLDRLGQTQMALERPVEAIPHLRKAAELSPRDSKILMHLGRALTSVGQSDEAKEVFARFRELGPDRSGTPHPPGLMDFLSLSPQEQMTRYRAGIERTVRANPQNAEAQVRYLKLLLEDGKIKEAADVARQVIDLKLSGPLLLDASAALLAAQQYGLAKDFLEKTTNGNASGDLALDLAVAISHTESRLAGLAQLDRIPETNRSADYFLLRAELLEASGDPSEATTLMEVALRSNPTRPDLYRWATTFLLRRGRFGEALDLLDRGSGILPGDFEIPLMRAITLAGLSKMAEAERVLTDIEKRWPDWYRVWMVHAILLQWQGQMDRSRQMIENAASLGGNTASRLIEEAVKIPDAHPDPADRALALMHLLFI